MPVSFNVPKQTPRSKYVIDTFQGVDFTSAGIDVDSSRSPYAPNMVRHTPGKVRKRMGYSTQALFTNGVNVNIAKGTSSEEQNIVINPNNINTRIKLYDLIYTVSQYEDLYFEFDYKSEVNFVIYGGRNTIIGLSPMDEWYHISTQQTAIYDEYISWLEIQSNELGNIYIKNFSVMLAKDAKYKWSPAPEGRYVLSDSEPYFYGQHSYRIPSNVKHLINVNRALYTNEDITDAIRVTNYGWVIANNLAEYVWTDGTHGRQLYIDFDYILLPEAGDPPAKAHIMVAGQVLPELLEPCDNWSDIRHYTATVNAGSFEDFVINIGLDTEAGPEIHATIAFGKLFVGYAIDDNYKWSKAPEDTGTNYRPYVYNKGKRNCAQITSYSSGTQTGSVISVLVPIIGNELPTDDKEVKGFFYATATIQITTDSPNQIYGIEISYCDNRGYTIMDTIEDDTDRLKEELLSGYKYEVYSNTHGKEYWIGYIKVIIGFNNNASCNITCSNMEVRSISPRLETADSMLDILHVGSSLFLSSKNNILFAGSAASNRSWADQLGENLILLDGTNIYDYAYGDVSITPIDEDICYVPTITVARSPSGGGIPYESINLLSPGFIDSFVVSADEAAVTQFQLSFNRLDNKTIKAWVLNSSGTWVEKRQGTDFSVNRETGVVTFSTAPGTTPISGQDNVRIQAYKTIEGYRDRIAKCKFCTVYGISANPDRVFVSGNPDFPNRDYFSEANDYTYFPDTNYSNLGNSSGQITGYTKLGNYLGTFKKENDHENSLILREGMGTTLEDGSYEVSFRIVNILQGEGLISPYTIGYLEGEPLYLTKKGIFAVTSNDGTDNKYGQNRSYYLNGKLNNEPKLENGYSTVFNNMYILALNNQLYILDGLQPSYTENEPYSTKQYSAFYCDSIPATCIWSDEDDLYFGTADGKLCKFYSEVDDISSYNDDGKEIIASWETPDLDGYLFYKNKTFRYFALRMMKAFKTSYKLFVDRNTVWVLIKEDVTKGRTFDFTNINFSQFSFLTVQTEKIGHTKLRVKKVDKARFKIENSVINQPFGIYDLAFEYIENGNYKR